MVAKIERSAHNASSVRSNAPTPGARNLSDQTMSTESAKDAAHLGALLSWIVVAGSEMTGGSDVRRRSSVRLLPHISVSLHNALLSDGSSPLGLKGND